ncbi:glycine cleavage system protein GcvH [Candidatus Berkiella cookevillensis]|uniref:Glycine cleavage system H protein n=1 Tax=Candidatus Berkiella cookevillensis TaxID=437022 RepID=A0A0Q9YLG5_9GAMM|nr:glycine cleavage system protein GcvH [Candidatus Berkiella cookevillensis]MCS5709558.1 glycine cleavage system protein GcvH [Candidatus Berkiella cookevillensis]
MSNIPKDLKYTTSHEWAMQSSATEIIIGVTDHAQALLGDIVFVELPEVGRILKKGEEFGVIESVKAASDLYAPLSGEVIAVNESLASKPELVNQNAYQDGWMLKIKPSDLSEWTELLNAQSYHDNIETAVKE